MNTRADRQLHFKAVCRAAGLKLTPQRMEIYVELAHASDHPSPEMLYQRLRPLMPALSLDTVYRTLKTLEQFGLSRKVDTFQSQVRYEAVQPLHHHLICRECQKISDFPWASFDDARLPKEARSWGLVERKSVVLTGLCRKCRNKGRGSKRRKAGTGRD